MGDTRETQNMFMSYSDWNAINRYRRSAYIEKMERERQRRANYYKRQRAFGCVLLLIAFAMLLVASLNDFRVMQGVGAAVAGVGLYAVLTRQMVLIDKYYLECMDKINLL